MFSRALRIATIQGIDVRLDPSLLLIAALVVWTFSTRFAVEHGFATAVMMGGMGAVLFFASILVHELAHALEARHRGLQVHGITLFLFGGVTEMEAHGHRARDEFMIAAVGPWASLVCGAFFGLVATSAGQLPAGVAGPVGQVAGLLGWLNVALAVFNLVPGAPLDGGRVLRALIWWVTGRRSVAIRITSWLGQALGVALSSFGLYVLVAAPGALGGIWYVVIGLFLFSAARSELRSSRLDDLYARATVEQLLGDLDRRPPVAVAVDVSMLPRVGVDDDLHTLVDAFDAHDVVAIERDGRVVSIVPEREVANALRQLGRHPRRAGSR